MQHLTLGKPGNIQLSRRSALAGIGGLTVATFVALGGARAQSGMGAAIRGKGGEGGFAPNAFVRIAPDDTVTVLIKHIEFGQGPWTGLSTLVAEELDADWDQMRAIAAPADVELYANTLMDLQGTGGSTAIANSYMQMRKAGACARAMLVSAAAKRWGIPAAEISVSEGVVSHRASGNSASFGDLADAAAKEDAPANPVLKDRADFRLIGNSVPKLDTRGKTDGSAKFTLDVYRDGMLTAVVAHPPAFGASVASFDARAARAVKGVVDVRQVPQGVAVYAANTYAALKGRDALEIEWSNSGAETRSSDQLFAEYRERAKTPGPVAAQVGDVDAALSAAGEVLEAEYVFPFLAHAPMEPLDAVIEQRGDTVEAWLGAQLQTTDHRVIAETLGVSQGNTIVNTMLTGGSFGRRAQPASQFAKEAADVFKATDRSRAVKLMWSREDDIRGGFYRPMAVHRLRGAIDGDGQISAWDQTIAAQSFLVGSPFEGMIENGIDATMVEGAREPYYRMPNMRLTAHTMDVGVPTLWWRSVGHTHTGYAVETFVDELLAKAGRDPVEGRLAWLTDSPRDAGVLERVAQLADWGRAPREGAAFGVALHKSFGTYVAQIAEVSMENGVPRVHRIWAAVDCGQPVNRNVIAAQLEGGIGYGLGAALFDEITLGRGGRVDQANFDTYRSLRIDEMPQIEVAIIDSAEDPTGVGEPGVPPVAPAVANAIRRLTGQAPRRLPFVTSRA